MKTADGISADPLFLSLGEASALLRRKKISPVELTRLALARVEALLPRLNAFLTVDAEGALRAARAAEREIMRGNYRGPLQGIPITLKDNLETAGMRTTAGSAILKDFIPRKNADAAERLLRSGAILLGKTNLHEFAYGITTENPHYGPARNPWNPDCIPGGSSGGSAAAVAAGMGFASLGTDTGGSVRIPSALCGIVGLKPNFGRVSCAGVVPLAPSFDHVGPLARSVADAAILLDAIASYPAPRNSFCRALAGKAPRKPGLRLGWPRDYFFDRIHPEVGHALRAAAKTFEKLGARLVQLSHPHLAESGPPRTQIALAEALAYHEGRGFFPGRAAEYGADVRKRLEMGQAVRAVEYLHALEFSETLRADFRAAFERVDAILAPAAPIPAPRLGQEEVRLSGKMESVRSLLVGANRPGNITGFPVISLPCGFTRDGLPIGMALHGPQWGEAGLLRIAFAYEQATEWHTRHPQCAGTR